MNLQHTCDNCDSSFSIKYDADECDDDPSFCPFCGELMVEFEQVDDDE